MNLNEANQPENNIDTLIEQTNVDLMLLRFEYMALKKSGRKDLEEMKNKIEEAFDDFSGIIKQRTMYVKYQKTMGVNASANSPEFLEKMKAIQSYVGSIVATVPKQ